MLSERSQTEKVTGWVTPLLGSPRVVKPMQTEKEIKEHLLLRVTMRLRDAPGGSAHVLLPNLRQTPRVPGLTLG